MNFLGSEICSTNSSSETRSNLVGVYAAIFLLMTGASARGDEKTANLDDDFTRQSAGQIGLAVQAQQCDLRSPVWLDKLINAVRHRLEEHFKEVRPTWTSAEIEGIAGQIIYGAVYGAKGDTGAPPPDPTDFMKSGEQTMYKSMTCQVTDYRKSDLLFLDGLTEGGGS